MIGNEKGITLITLVITVILIFILVSITIDFSADGKIFNRAKETVMQQEIALYLTELEEYKQMHPNKTTKKPINADNQEIKKYIASFNETKYGDIISVVENELVYSTNDTSIINIMKNLGVREKYNPLRGYIELDWIESNGGQYIDTGIIGKTGVSSEIKMKSLENSDSDVLGSRKGDTRIYLAHLYECFTIGYNEFYTSTIRYDKQDHLIKTSLKENKQIMNVDGQDVIDLNLDQYTDTKLPMYAFALNYNGNAEYFSSTRIYYMKIWEQNEEGEDVLVRDYIPVLRESDNEIGLFDKVTNTFFENKGIAPFYSEGVNKLIQPEIPRAYEKIEYIVSDGTGQYIDTGVNATSKLSSETGVQLLAKGDISICAARSGNTRLYLLHYYSGGYKIGFGSYYGSYTPGEDNYHIINTIVKNKEQKITIDNRIYYSQELIGNYDLGLNLYIFAMNYDGNDRYPSNSRIYYMKIWEENNSGEDELIRYFIPCYRKSDRKYGLYDTVTKAFFENQGEGIITGSE